MKYTFTHKPPKPPKEEGYYHLAETEFKRLLQDVPDDEKAFQTFFERNPSFVPGARAEFDFHGPSGHGPHLSALISQPKLNGLVTRSPDFLWFAYDSQVLNPILIEIEAPNKKYFNQDGTPTSSFTTAKNQLDEWQTLLSRPENVLRFLNDFNLPKDLTDLYFEPFYVLIYGRREEYQDKPWLKQKRATLLSRTDRQFVMSYDRLKPQLARRNFICCEVKQGRYIAKYLTPTFTLNIYDNDLLAIENLENAIEPMQFTSDERKQFLKQRLPHLLAFFKSPDKGGDYGKLIFDGRSNQYEE